MSKLLILIVSYIVSSCAGDQDYQPTGAKSCPQLNITNGVLTNDSQFDAVVPFYDKAKKRQCTAIMVEKNVALTSAHCIVDPQNADIEIEANGKIYSPSRLAIHSQYRPTGGENNSDLALLYFNEAVMNNTLPICDFIPAKRGKAKIVGFGLIDNIKMIESEGKREGVTNLLDRGNGLIYTSGAVQTTNTRGENSSTGVGDSGGPLLLKNRYNQYCIIGVTQSGGLPLTKGQERAVFVDIHSNITKSFLTNNGVTYPSLISTRSNNGVGSTCN